MLSSARKLGSFIQDKLPIFSRKKEHKSSPDLQTNRGVPSDDESVHSVSSDDDGNSCPTGRHGIHARPVSYQFGSDSGMADSFTYVNKSHEGIFKESKPELRQSVDELVSGDTKSPNTQNQNKKRKVDRYFGREKRKYDSDDPDSDVDDVLVPTTDTSDYFSGGLAARVAEQHIRAKSVPNVFFPMRFPVVPPPVIHIGKVENSNVGSGNTIMNNPFQDFQTAADQALQSKVKERTKSHLEQQSVDGVKTEAYKRLKAKIQHGPKLAILKGNGGNFMGRMLLKELSEESDDDEQFEPYVLKEPEEMIAVNKKRKAVVFIPNINDRHDQSRYRKWREALTEEIYPMLCHHDTLIVVATFKTFPETFTKISDLERDAKLYRFVIDIGSIPIDTKERQRLIWHEIDRFGISVCERQKPHTDHSKCISEDGIKHLTTETGNFLFPERVAEFFSQYSDLNIDHFRRPSLTLVEMMTLLEQKHVLPLLALLTFGGKLSESDILRYSKFRMKGLSRSCGNIPQVQTQALLLKKMMEYATANDLSQDMWENIELGLRELSGTIVASYDGEYHFDGDAMKYAFMFSAPVPLEVIIASSDDWFFYNYIVPIVPHVLADDVHNLVYIKRSSEKEKVAVFGRLSADINNQKVQKVWTHPLMEEWWFCHDFLNYMKQTYKKLSPYIFQTDERHTQNTVLYFGVFRPFRGSVNPANVTDMVLQHPSYLTKWRTDPTYRNLIMNDETETLSEAVKLERISTVKNLLQKGVQVQSDLLLDATETQNFEIIKLLLEVQTTQKLLKHPINFEIRCKALSRCLELYSQEPTEIRKQNFRLLSSSCSINYRRDDVESLIIMATARCDMVMLKLLVDNHLETENGCLDTGSNNGAALGFVKRTVLVNNNRPSSEKIDLNLITKTRQTALTVAVTKQSHEVIRFLLANGADQLNMNRRNMQLPIMIAIEQDDPESLQILMEFNPSVVNARNKYGMTPLHQAVASNSENCFKVLLASKKLNIDVVNDQNETALHKAVAYEKDRFVEVFLKTGADLLMQDIDKNTPLDVAITMKNMYCAEILLKAAKSRKMPQDNRVLLRALRRDDRTLLAILFKCGYDINCQIDRFRTPLMIAMEMKNRDLMRFLLKRKANPEFGRNGIPPIHSIRNLDDVDMIDILHDFQAELNTRNKDNGNTILHTAVLSKDHAMAAAILERDKQGDLVDVPNAKGDRPLHVACRNGDEQCVRVLLRNGATHGVFNREMVTPEQEAEKNLRMQQYGTREQEFRYVLHLLKES